MMEVSEVEQRSSGGLDRPLSGLRVLDLVPGPMAVATRLLAELGADVVRLSPDGCGSACKRDPVSGVIGVQKGTTIPMV